MPRLNIFLFIIAIALGVYLYIELYSGRHLLPLTERLKAQRDTILPKALSKIEKRSFSYYGGIIKTRQIFRPLIGKERTEKQPSRLGLEESLSKFVLLGIVSVGDKAQAMIRDTQTKRDYYCVVGEKIDGFEVKEVLRDRVILQFDGETVELSP